LLYESAVVLDDLAVIALLALLTDWMLAARHGHAGLRADMSPPPL
jgi:hypothetical protein